MINTNLAARRPVGAAQPDADLPKQSGKLQLIEDPILEADTFELSSRPAAEEVPALKSSIKSLSQLHLFDEQKLPSDILELSHRPAAELRPAAVVAEPDDIDWETFPLDHTESASELLSPADLEACKVTIRDGQFFHTDGVTPFISKSQKVRFILDTHGQLYIDGDLKDAVGSHGSFIGDNRVRCAGNMLIKLGPDGMKIAALNNQSGHYKPSAQALSNMKTWLENQGVTVARITNFSEV
jgi:hypothetical protein